MGLQITDVFSILSSSKNMFGPSPASGLLSKKCIQTIILVILLVCKVFHYILTETILTDAKYMIFDLEFYKRQHFHSDFHLVSIKCLP